MPSAVSLSSIRGMSASQGAWECVHGVDGRDWCEKCYSLAKPEPLLGVAYPDIDPEIACILCGEDYDDEGACACADEPWYDEDQGHDEQV